MLLLAPDELLALTGYKQPAAQLAELQQQGYWRARRAPITGRVILGRAHCDALADLQAPYQAPDQQAAQAGEHVCHCGGSSPLPAFTSRAASTPRWVTLAPAKMP